MRFVWNYLLLRLRRRRSRRGLARRRCLARRADDLDSVSDMLAELVRPSVEDVTGDFNRAAGADRAGRISGCGASRAGRRGA